MKKENKNLRLYPKYRPLSRDFLFFYTINVLFLTQIKKIDVASVVLIHTFYALFIILCQIPATLIIEKIGRKRGVVLGNICNAIYLIMVINSIKLIQFIIAELICALAFSLKDIGEPSILHESIISSSIEKSNIFAKIQGNATSGYYLLSAVSLILSGFLYEINGYIPLFLSLGIVIITILMSTRFEEINVPNDEQKNEKTSIKEAIKFSIKSKRCRCLLIYSAVFYGVISVLATYEISLLENLGLASKYIGISFAVLNIVSAISSRKQYLFHKKFKNRTLSIIGILLSLSIIMSGGIVLLEFNLPFTLIIIFSMYIIKYFAVGLYNVLLIKYLTNFTNSKIDTKIFAVNSFANSVTSVVLGLFASKLLKLMPITNAMFTFGIFSLVAMIITLIYMKNKVGLEPNKYSSYELKYDSKS